MNLADLARMTVVRSNHLNAVARSKGQTWPRAGTGRQLKWLLRLVHWLDAAGSPADCQTFRTPMIACHPGFCKDSRRQLEARGASMALRLDVGQRATDIAVGCSCVVPN